MFFINLTTTVGLGQILLIVCYLLLVVTEIYSKSDTTNQLMAIKPEASTMKGNFISGVIIRNKDVTSNECLKRTHRKKRGFGNLVEKYVRPSINTTMSTCTPFFIRRSKNTHRKTTRLKNPTLLNRTKVYSYTENDLVSQTQNKGKIKKLLFHKHSSTPLNETNSSESLDNLKRTKYTTTDSLSLPEPQSETITHGRLSPAAVSTDRLYQNNNECDPLTTKYHLSTSKVNVEQLSSDTSEHYASLQPFTAEYVTESDLVTRENQMKDATVNVTHLINTTKPFNTTVSRSNIMIKKFHLMNIFHFTKCLTLASPESERESKTRELGDVLEPYNTTEGTYSMSAKTTKNDTTAQPLTRNHISPSFLTNSTFQLKKLFHIPKKLKPPFSDDSTEKLEESDSAEPITDVLETQIPSSPSQGIIKKYNNRGEVDRLSTVSSSSVSTENSRKFLNFRNILHRERRTTLNTTVGSSKLGKWSTLKTNYVDSDYISGSSLTSVVTQSERGSKTDTWNSQGNENHVTHPFNFEKQRMKEGHGNDYSIFENTAHSFEGSGLDQSHKETNAVSRLNAVGGKTTTTHNPFKIKYLMQFRRPVSNSSSNNSSWTHLTTRETCIDDREHTCGKEHDAFVKTATESMDTSNNLSRDFEAPNGLECDADKIKSDKSVDTTNNLQNGFNFRDKNSNDSEKLEGDVSANTTLQGEKTEGALKINEIMKLKKHKSHAKNKNWKHNTRKIIDQGKYDSRKQFCYYKPSTTESFKESFNITVYREDSRPFRNLIFRRTTRAIKNKAHKNQEKNTFRWCFQPTFNQNRSTTKFNLVNNHPENISTTQMLPKSGQKDTATFSSLVSDKKFKNLFHFKTSHIPISEDQTTGMSVPDYVIKENTNDINTKPIQSNKTTRKYDKKYQTPYGSLYSDMHSSKSNVTPVWLEHTSVNNPTESHHQSERATLKLGLNSTDAVEPNISIKAKGREKVKQFFNKFHTKNRHSFNNTLNLKNNFKNASQKTNHSIILNPEYADYIETNIGPKKHKKHFHRTVLHNASDFNDTSFNVMAYVMKPLDSLVGVFKALSPNSVTKIGDVNATDIRNGSLPNHLQPTNSSIVILAVNNTNATSKDIHESKLTMALDLLGGMYHCVFNSFAEARPGDVRFYLYTRGSPEEPEELVLPPLPTDDNATDNPDLPEPVLEKEFTSESPLDKREIEEDEDDYEEYDFEPLNPAKSEIQSKWFNVRANTKVLIHGYLQDYQTDIMVSMREAYLSRGPYNVVVVDWSVLVGDSSCYPVVASRGLRQVGGLLAQLLNHLVDAGVSPSSIHIVGFSLGAHVAGHAGTFLSHGLVSRITGLDPALPYVPMEPDVSLDSDDAVFVDIIHSAAGLLGQSGPMGHVDFYPNGGSQQPGCEVSSLGCSHRRAALYFIESIASDSGFHAIKCDSWHHFQADNCSDPATVSMGDPCPANTSGKYYLVTGYKSPFALQPDEHLKVKKSLLLDLFYDSEDL